LDRLPAVSDARLTRIAPQLHTLDCQSSPIARELSVHTDFD
jgi:hypothetical protein